MQALAKTNHLGRVPTVAMRGSWVTSLVAVVTIISTALAVAVLIGWIVAATLGLGADGHPGVGPDRPPTPMIAPPRVLV